MADDERDDDAAPAPGGFVWGLTPGGGAGEPAEQPAAEQPQPEPAQPEPTEPVTPPAPVPPAEPYLPPNPVVPAAPVVPQSPPPVEPFLPPSTEPVGTEPTSPEPSSPEPAGPEPTTAAAPPPLVDPLDQPTQAISAEEFAADLAAYQASLPPAADPPPVDPSIAGPTEVLHPPALGLPEPPGEGLETEHLEPTDLDHLFGDQAFQDYAGEPMVTVPVRRVEAVETASAPEAVERMPKQQKVLLIIAGSLVGILALVALFLVGTRLASVFGPAPAVTADPTPSASASVVPDDGALPPGDYRWDQLRGGECLDPFESAWQDVYTVVDCAQPHAGQLVGVGVFPDAEGTAYPGIEELQSRINVLCTDPAVIDYGATGQISDLQVSASFAADQAEWDDGYLGYQCFVNRASGEPLTASVAVPPAAPAAG